MTSTTESPIPLSSYRLINEAAAKKAYDAFAGPRGKRSTKEKMRDALAAYEQARNQPTQDLSLNDLAFAEAMRAYSSLTEPNNFALQKAIGTYLTHAHPSPDTANDTNSPVCNHPRNECIQTDQPDEKPGVE